MSVTLRVVRVAVPSPLARHFDYLLPNGIATPEPGARVRVPFGRREVIGIVLSLSPDTEVSPDRLKKIERVLDKSPLLPSRLLELLVWSAAYYHHPIGDVIQTALPVLLRRGSTPETSGEKYYSLSPAAAALKVEMFKRSPKQQQVFLALRASPTGLNAAALAQVTKNWRDTIKRFQQSGYILITEQIAFHPPVTTQSAAPPLSSAQTQAVQGILATRGRFHCHLLHGITGSGKTEVYLQAIETAIEQGGQALVLVPEIGLTPQLLSRFEGRLKSCIAILHSGMNDSERLRTWQAARTGQATVLIGTRSAVFVPMPNLRLIIVDEEHDTSYKQQDGFRYHARDVAIMRARLEGLPIVLGSATPSLESLHNAQQGRYQLLSLPERAANAQPPQVILLDLKRLKLNEGLSAPLIEAVQMRLQKKEQSLLFLNRRGFAPVMMCHACGWLAPCARCDARLTLHQRRRLLCCHHCGAESRVPVNCPACASTNLQGIGAGTERIESTLTRLFPQARIERIDRDSTRRKGVLEAKLERVHRGEADILVGTQMLAKGHDFPNLTLVGVINADQGLYSADFRSEERLLQQLVQVTGRAGRAQKAGQVFIQTFHPENPAFAALAHHDYLEFGNHALAERAAAHYPPYVHFAMLRAEAAAPGAALAFLRSMHALAQKLVQAKNIQVLDPVASPMERRAGRYRAQLLVQANERKALHFFLNSWLAQREAEKLGRRVRWSLDVDPMEMY